jgi:hypothetical protein
MDSSEVVKARYTMKWVIGITLVSYVILVMVIICSKMGIVAIKDLTNLWLLAGLLSIETAGGELCLNLADKSNANWAITIMWLFLGIMALITSLQWYIAMHPDGPPGGFWF